MVYRNTVFARRLSIVAILLFAICLLVRIEAQQETGSGTPAQQAQSVPASQPDHAIARKLTVNGVKNFGEVTPFLYRGAQPSHEGFEELAKKMGVQVVVNARPTRNNREEQEVTKLGMKYVHIPWCCMRPKDEILAKFLTTMRENSSQKVFVHCQLGKDRTGMMIAAYRMAEQGWTAPEAMHEMQAFGFTAFHHITCPRLAGYEKRFPKHLETNPALKAIVSRENEQSSK
jgi:tyrosine-protein phosphatase SIW14